MNRTALLLLTLGISVPGCSEYELTSGEESVTGDLTETEVTDTPPPAGGSPDIAADPGSVALGVICDSEAQEVQIANNGDAVLSVSEITVTGDGWSLESAPELPAVIAPGDAIAASVVGAGEGSLGIRSDDPDTPLLEIPLSATANTPPEVTIVDPLDGEILEPGVATSFTAQIDDDTDDPGSFMVTWISDVDGQIATGLSSAAGEAVLRWDSSNQSSGTHSLTARAADGCDETATDTITFCQNEGYVADNLDLSTWNFEGSAVWDSVSNVVQLTEPTTNQAGTAFQTASTVSSDSVSIGFSFYVSGGTGADGISLTALDSGRMTGFVGEAGGGIGYGGLPGWNIEVDTWYNSENNDPTQDDHLSVHIDGVQSSYEAWSALPEMEDGAWHEMNVTVTGTWMTIEVDGAIYIDQDIPRLSAFPAYVGFTAATGGSTNYHLIDALEVEAFVCDE